MEVGREGVRRAWWAGLNFVSLFLYYAAGEEYCVCAALELDMSFW